MSEVVIRPARESDLEQLVALAKLAGPGMTNFPPDAELLSQKLSWSDESFAKSLSEPEQEYYYFVMESIPEQQVVGCCGIFSQAGGEMPFYSYKLAKEQLVSKDIGLNKEIQKLYLLHDYNDASEVATLFLHPDYRMNNNGEMLSRCRFLFMRNFLDRFAQKIIAEMRGVVDSQGRSPFWDSLGSKFFDISFVTADRLCSMGQKQFIGDLMPRCPIYVPMLAKKAQAVIGKVHPNTAPALRLLKKEGFHFEGYIDIFDAGPTVEARVVNVHTVKKCRQAKVVGVRDELPKTAVGNTNPNGSRYMISNCALGDFRVTSSALAITKKSMGACLSEQDSRDPTFDEVLINSTTAEALHLGEGDTLSYIKFPFTKRKQQS